MGIVSIFDALLDVKPEYIFKELSLDKSIQDALINYSGKLGQSFLLCLNIEKSDFNGIKKNQEYLNIDDSYTMQCYARSLNFADQSLI